MPALGGHFGFAWMKLSQVALFVVLSLTAAPGIEAPMALRTSPREDALSVAAAYETAPSGPLRDRWSPKHARVIASYVRLDALGARTHANWVVFELPFDTTKLFRVKNVRFRPTSAAPTRVGALRIGSVCVEVRAAGSVEDWALYTESGVAATQRFLWHPAPPTRDPTALGVNVPTRVANYAACEGDERLRDPATWVLDVDWEER